MLDCVQIGHCGPHPHVSSACLLFCGLFSVRVWGIAACFGGVFSSAFSVLTKEGVGASFILGGTGHDALATNRLVEASIVFDHGVSSLVSGAVNGTVVVVLGCCATAIGGEWTFFLLELSCGIGNFLNSVLGQVVYCQWYGAWFGSSGC